MAPLTKLKACAWLASGQMSPHTAMGKAAIMLGISSLVCSQVLDFFHGARPYRNIAEQPAIKLEGDVERDASAL